MSVNPIGLWTMRCLLVIGAIVAGIMGSEAWMGCMGGLVASFIWLSEDEPTSNEALLEALEEAETFYFNRSAEEDGIDQMISIEISRALQIVREKLEAGGV